MWCRTDSKNEHHVCEVHSLAPGRWPDLDPGWVNQKDDAISHQEIRRLDISVGEARVPKLPDDRQPRVGHSLVHVCPMDFGSPCQELGDHHLLALRRSLHTP